MSGKSWKRPLWQVRNPGQGLMPEAGMLRVSGGGIVPGRWVTKVKEGPLASRTWC